MKLVWISIPSFTASRRAWWSYSSGLNSSAKPPLKMVLDVACEVGIVVSLSKPTVRPQDQFDSSRACRSLEQFFVVHNISRYVRRPMRPTDETIIDQI
jgi:hypothetical protein